MDRFESGFGNLPLNFDLKVYGGKPVMAFKNGSNPPFTRLAA
jgi:hypothetical protein